MRTLAFTAENLPNWMTGAAASSNPELVASANEGDPIDEPETVSFWLSGTARTPVRGGNYDD